MTVWITGASSGIGEACAFEYARKGERLILTSSSREGLAPVGEKCRRLGAADIKLLPADLSRPELIEPLCRAAWAAFDGIDIAFFNAGISQRTCVEDTSTEMLRRLMEINFFAPAVMARELLGPMTARGGGQMAVTTSIAGRFGFPLRCGYSASKHALYGFFETLQAEYASKGIRVTLVCPGRICTPISLRALDKGGVPHAQMDPGQATGLPAEAAARQIVRAIAKGRREVLVGQKELLMVYIKRFFPGLAARLARRIAPC